MSEITRYKLHCGWLYECASYFKPAAIQDDVPMVLASDHDKRVAELEAELAEAVELLKVSTAGSVRFFVCGPVAACRQAGPDFHHVGLMNRSPYRIAN